MALPWATIVLPPAISARQRMTPACDARGVSRKPARSKNLMAGRV